MPINGILNTARSLAYYTRLQEVTANNMANLESDAFKVDRVTARLSEGHPVPVQKTDLGQGTFRDTGRPLDVGLDGPGFFMVRTDHGERLTRGGSMHLDVAGRLTDSHGDPLLGEQGPIVADGAELEVQNDGTVAVDGTPVGKLRVVTVDDPTTLAKEGAGRYAPASPVRQAPEGSVRVRQGVIEESNGDPLLGMMDMITIQRAFSANLDALRAMDGVLGVVTSEVGRVA